MKWFLLVSIAALAAAASTCLAAPGERMRNVENGLRDEDQPDQAPTWTLDERMEHYRIPGVSVAVISDFKLDWAKGYGLADRETETPVTTDTIFQAASLSKVVTAAGALRAVETGRISLDDDINAFLRSWQLPGNEHTAAAPVTLRQLLGHTAGTAVSGFIGYAADAALPTLLQVLDGEEPANTPPIRVDLPPGTDWRYSGGGYCVVQQALIDLYGEPFADIMERNVFAPLGMKASLFTERLSGDRSGAAAGYRADGAAVPGGWRSHPEMAAAGLWATPSDLARLIIALQRALRGDEGVGLPESAAEQMFSTTVTSEYGLGIQLLDKNGEPYFSHGGANIGYKCCFMAHQTAGCGAVIMTNCDNGDSLIPELLAAIAAEYGWPGYFPRPEAP